MPRLDALAAAAPTDPDTMPPSATEVDPDAGDITRIIGPPPVEIPLPLVEEMT